LQIVWLPLVVQVNGGCPGSLQYVRLPLVVQVRVSGSVDPGCSCAVGAHAFSASAATIARHVRFILGILQSYAGHQLAGKFR
jgi:hypothetical protein